MSDRLPIIIGNSTGEYLLSRSSQNVSNPAPNRISGGDFYYIFPYLLQQAISLIAHALLRHLFPSPYHPHIFSDDNQNIQYQNPSQQAQLMQKRLPHVHYTEVKRMS